MLNKKILLFILGLLILIKTPLCTAYFNEPDDFRGIKWGTELESIQDEFVFNSKSAASDDILFYTRKGDVLKLGSAQLDFIKYAFFEGKLVWVWITFHGIDNFHKLRDEMFNRYLPVDDQNKNFPVLSGVSFYYQWGGILSDADRYYTGKTDMLLEYSSAIDYGSLIITGVQQHKIMMKKIDDARLRAAGW
jgi:hypothetical protein